MTKLDNMKKKYEFTGETINLNGLILKRIRRISDKLIGGWIQSEDNLYEDMYLKTRVWVVDEYDGEPMNIQES
jgi:hypothetical protein